MSSANGYILKNKFWRRYRNRIALLFTTGRSNLNFAIFFVVTEQNFVHLRFAICVGGIAWGQRGHADHCGSHCLLILLPRASQMWDRGTGARIQRCRSLHLIKTTEGRPRPREKQLAKRVRGYGVYNDLHLAASNKTVRVILPAGGTEFTSLICVGV